MLRAAGLVCLLTATALLRAQQLPELKPGIVLERALSGGEAHEYRISLTPGQFLQAVAEQQGIDVELFLLGPDGRQVTHVDSQNGVWGPETVVAIAAEGGEYRLRVASGNPGARAGKYELQLLALREATAQDRDHINANRAVEQAQDLFAQSTGSSSAMQAAAEKLRSALPFYRSARLRYDEALTLYTLGLAQAQSGDFHGALQSDEESLVLFQALGDKAMQGSTITNMGGAYDVLGDLQKALAAYQQALPLLRSSGDRQSEASVLNNIGKIQADMANWQEALEYYRQALPIFHESGGRAREAITLTNLGSSSYELGEPRRALDYFRQALPLHQAAGNKRGEADTLLRMGSAHWALDEPAEAVRLYQQAIELNRAIGDRWREGSSLLRLGTANAALGETEKSLGQLQQSLNLLKATGDHRGEGLALSSLGRVYAAQQQPEKALASFGQALAILQQVGDRNYSAQALAGMAQVERDKGQFPQARKHAEQALLLVEQVRAGAGGQDDRASYFATQHSLSEFYIDLLMRMHRRDPSAAYDVEAFEAAERARARSLLEMLAEARVDFRQGVDTRLLQREHALSEQLNAKSQKLLGLRGEATEQQAAELRKEIGALESEYQQAQVAIRKSSPQYSAITQPQPLTLKKIQQQVLDADTILLEYSLGDERSYVWAVSTGGLKTYELPKRSEIEKSVREVYGLLTARSEYVRGESAPQRKQRIAAADAQLPAASARLSALVLGPVAADLGNQRLVLVTDGSLQHIPFAMLPIPGAADAAPLVTAHEVLSLPSASTVAELRKEIAGRRPAPGLIAVIADPVFEASDPRVTRKNAASAAREKAAAAAKTVMVAEAGQPAADARNQAPRNEEARGDDARILVHLAAASPASINGSLHVPRLPFTRQEADRIMKLVPAKNSMEALDFRASLATATSATLARYRYLHFATHGFLDSEHPELSAIVLSLVDRNGRQQEGFLRAGDIYNLKLPADLVVLSACQTGLGKEIRGEGIVGLTRGFMYAGVPRVIVSLWSVNDRATEELMAVFYEKLLKGKLSPAAALRQAQVAMWKSKPWSAPYYWAAFVQQGEWK